MADSPFTPDMQAQIQQLLQLQTDRSARTAPIHQAAMAMAQRMAPGYAQGAMTAPSSLPRPTGGSITPNGSSSGAPGIATTAMMAFIAALLKPGSPLLAMLKGGAGFAGAGGVGAAAGNPASGPTAGSSVARGGLPVAAGGAGGAAGMSGSVPGYFTNPDGSMVGIGGDPANGGRYGGGLFQDTDPRHD